MRPRVQIVRLRAMLAHILVDPSEELFRYIHVGKGRMETGQMKVVRQVATESKCSPNAGAVGSLQELWTLD